MRQLNIQEIQIISGGNNEEVYFSPLGAILGVLGTSLAYCQPLMSSVATGTPNAAGVIEWVTVYQPQTFIFVCGAVLGYSLGFAIQKEVSHLYA